ncbi:target of Sbf [Pleosporales sp. CAS-2024a]
MHTLQKRRTVPFHSHGQAVTGKEASRSVQAVDTGAMATGTQADKQLPGETGVRRAAGDWKQVAYYTSTSPAQATGLTFLANLGDPRVSGTFDYAFGNSLSYVSSDGHAVAPGSMPFNGELATSEREMAVFTDKWCDQDCPYWRTNATAHFGWSGSSKAFLIEFQMDHHPNVGTDQGAISDAPAWWFLNAAIPRVLQYGNDRNNVPCSCWSTGCGEFDAFEVLGQGEERAKSTLHRQGNLEGGDSNYFRRPVGKTLKFAVFWTFPNITARVLDDHFDFGESLSDAQVQQLVSYDANSWTHSLFAIGR